MVLSLIAAFFHEQFEALGFPLHLYLLWTAVALTLCALVFYAADCVKKLKGGSDAV